MSATDLHKRTVGRMLTVHAEDAAFLWLTRDNAVRAPHYALKDLAKLDDRVEAHIDGLRVAGDDGWALALEQLKHPEGGEYFAAMVLALESGRKEKIAAVVERAQEAGPLRGIVSALGWVDWEVAKPAVGGLIASTEPRLRRIAIAACAITRNNPGIHLANALAHADPALRARACRAVGELARKDLVGDAARRSPGLCTLVEVHLRHGVAPHRPRARRAAARPSAGAGAGLAQDAGPRSRAAARRHYRRRRLWRPHLCVLAHPADGG